ncbi:hypothetical protein H4217_007265 [Coemansia sp. RSA 1939]|nr:hypothetical protein H4217_007265 [Coemansia sp. RSA 1939]KAJ2609366.1 hypothetical protein EV177_004500 [Coemansia sp. RSA 1804]KAJ2681843.1 hypothetical protein GGH99_005008 [Coemansia sp. RSA 1285]
MDKIFSLVDAAQPAPALAQHDGTNAYIMPPWADSYETWTYPDTQQTMFEDWIASAVTPPSTAIASPDMGQNVLLAAATSAPHFSFGAYSAAPSLSPPSSALSAGSSPLIANDLALSIASTLQATSAAATPAASVSPQQQTRMFPGVLTVADYAAALFPEIAAGLSSSLASPEAALEPVAAPKRSASLASLQLPSTAAPDAVDWTADISSLFSGSPAAAAATRADFEPPKAAASAAPVRAIKKATKPRSKPKPKAAKPSDHHEASAAAAVSAAPEFDASVDLDGLSVEEQRKRRDTEFLASLPPQLALKRRRTSNSKQKEKILAELMGDSCAQQSDDAAASCDFAEEEASPEPSAAADAMAAEPIDEAEEENDAHCQSLDAAALKRKKNTDAARRSRMRKILRIETLESRVSELETENSKLSQLVADMESERAVMAQRMEEYERRLAAQAATSPSFAL